MSVESRAFLIRLAVGEAIVEKIGREMPRRDAAAGNVLHKSGVVEFKSSSETARKTRKLISNYRSILWKQSQAWGNRVVKADEMRLGLRNMRRERGRKRKYVRKWLVDVYHFARSYDDVMTN